MTHIQPTDISTLRDLLTYARAAGWEHLVYEDGRGHEHVWRKRAPGRHPAQVSLWQGGLEYKLPDKHIAKATMRPESADEAREWLRGLRLVPSVREVAEAVLSA